MGLKNWLMNFYGVSTKYCLNYLKWFRFKDSFMLESIKTMIMKAVVAEVHIQDLKIFSQRIIILSMLNA